MIDNDQTVLLDPIKEGIIGRDHVHELGDLLNGKVRVKQPPRGDTDNRIIYYKNNSGLANSVRRRRRRIYRKAVAEGSNKVIPDGMAGQ